jgi:hypothetical protein
MFTRALCFPYLRLEAEVLVALGRHLLWERPAGPTAVRPGRIGLLVADAAADLFGVVRSVPPGDRHHFRRANEGGILDRPAAVPTEHSEAVEAPVQGAGGRRVKGARLGPVGEATLFLGQTQTQGAPVELDSVLAGGRSLRRRSFLPREFR